jgi:hypothetical protein
VADKPFGVKPQLGAYLVTEALVKARAVAFHAFRGARPAAAVKPWTEQAARACSRWLFSRFVTVIGALPKTVAMRRLSAFDL